MKYAKPFGSNDMKNPRDSIYQSYRFKKFSRRFKDQNPLCANCLKKGISTIGCIMDHVVPIAIGGSIYNEVNCQTLCKGCDVIKRNMEKNGTWKIEVVKDDDGFLIPGGGGPTF